MSTRVLIVDDEPEARAALGMVLSGDGQTCEFAADAATALEILAQRTFEAVVCDVRMEGMSGLELLDRVKAIQPALPFIVITALGRVPDAVDAMKRGAFQYVTKPWNVDDLRAMVATAIADRQRRERVEAPPRSEPPGAVLSTEIIGPGPAMCTLQASIDLVATSTAPVLITGETGVGKELVARAVHWRGDRRGRPFVAVNTSAVHQDLFESELFGHMRGAFTGAAQSRKGLLTEADSGTILLDEIGDMPLGMQSKLLRVLQFGEVRPVGSDRSHQVNVRVIAATHRDLLGLVREGRFREDLYFRLNVLPLFVPPLREHREDIPALAMHFLAEARGRATRSRVRTISEEALRMLSAAPWPGNVRELASVIERAVVFSSEEALSPGDFGHVSNGEPQMISWPPINRSPWTLRRLSYTYTEWVLGQTGGNKQRAAEILGIDLSTLYRWQRAQQD